MNENVDVIVIGAGQAGPSLAVRFADAGRRVILIEKARLGGSCVNTGCIPTKTLELDGAPRRLIVVGGSYIGLEFAQIYRRFGSEVTVVEFADRIIAREDDDVSAAVQAMLEDEGVAFHLDCRDIVGAGASGGVRVSWASHGQAGSVEGDFMLAAVGRRPNVEALDLDKGAVALDARGFIQVDDHLMTSAPGVYALGDVNGRGAFTHTSYNDYEILTARLIDGEDRTLAGRVFGYALFTDPPLARVGLGDHGARASGRNILRAERAMSRVGRARERGETTGFMRALVDAESEHIVGATLFGIEADEVIHQFIQAMVANLRYKALMRAVPVHPTVSALIPTLLGTLKPLEAAA